MTSLSPTRIVLCALIAVLAVLATASAQQLRTQQLETRSALAERADREARAGNRGIAAAIRARLQDGDFREGDRVVILFENMPAGPGEISALIRADTISVRMGGVLQFPPGRYPGVTDLKVAGLLRSELPDTVVKHFAVIYRNPQLRVTPLVALSVTGAVQRGGYVDVPGDMRLTDVFATAGGMAADADVGKIVIMRGPRELMSRKQVQDALDYGLTVDASQLRAGDQIMVPRKTNTNWLSYTGLVMSMVGLVVAISRGDW